MTPYETLVGPGIGNIGSIIENEFRPAVDLVASLHRDLWKDKAVETRSYLSGDYYRNIHVVEDAFGSGTREIVSDVGYGDIIETIGWGTNNPPRYPAKLAIEAAEFDTTKILDDAAQRVIETIQ